jgi:hypothetical protein
MNPHGTRASRPHRRASAGQCSPFACATGDAGRMPALPAQRLICPSPGGQGIRIPDYRAGSASAGKARNNVKRAFMVSLSNHEGVVRPAAWGASWFDKLTMKRFPGTGAVQRSQPGNQVRICSSAFSPRRRGEGARRADEGLRGLATDKACGLWRWCAGYPASGLVATPPSPSSGAARHLLPAFAGRREDVQAANRHMRMLPAIPVG